MLFMPHSPGVYIALVLEGVGGNALEEANRAAGEKSPSKSQTITKRKVRNGCFLDLKSLPNTMQYLLK